MALLLAKRNLIVFSTTVIVAMNGHLLPDAFWLVPLLAVVLVSYRFEKLRFGYAVFLATVVSLVHAHQFVRQTNTLFDCAGDITINVRIESSFKSNLYFSTSPVAYYGKNACGEPISGRLLLRVKGSSVPFAVGEVWQVRAKPIPIRGLNNGVGFDAERYYFSRSIQAKANLVEAIKKVRQPSVRGLLFQQFFILTDGLERQALLLALMFGDRAEIDSDTWQGLKQSGLAHLIAISGLHIGMAFGIGWWFGFVIRLVLREFFYAPFFFAAMLALLYAWLAGFSLPTQRALIMCLVWAGLKVLDIRLERWHLLSLVLAIILALSPFSSLDPSLWLSLGAVSVVFVAASLTSDLKSYWLRGAALQLLLFIGLIPVSQLLLGGFSAVALLYNLLFIPMVSVLVVPLLFLGFILMPLQLGIAAPLFKLCDGILGLMTRAIELSHTGYWIESPFIGLCLIALGFALLIYRHRALVGTIALVLTSSSTQPIANWRMDVLDVGHGLAVLVTSGNRSLLYDTGAGWDGGSFAKQVIVPVLKEGATPLDKLFISHGDNDHSGGAADVLAFSPHTLGFSSQLSLGFLPCVQGMHLWWQGLQLRVLWPVGQVYRAYNPHSCVIEISDGNHKLLLTGDIDLLAEYQMQDVLGKVDVVIVPHHGSNTSSSARFVQLTSPKVAIASASSSAQWTFPAPQVRARYEQNGSQWLDTGQYGRVVVRFFDQSIQVSSYRDRQSDAWYRQILRKGVE